MPGVTITADLEKFQKLCNLVMDKSTILRPEDICISDFHHDIVGFINSFPEEDELCICNIDHHHDCGYYRQPQDLAWNAELNVSNWVAFINEKQPVTYIWVRNETATGGQAMGESALKSFSSTIDLEAISHIKFDKIFLCRSPEWIPKQYLPLFEVLARILIAGVH